ncbi:low molecular weight phosphatase family protein [Humibacter ginsengiterrae]
MSLLGEGRHRSGDDGRIGKEKRGTFTVLTVCTGNVHRSALAAELLATWAKWYLPPTVATHVAVTSAGTGAPVGEPMGQDLQSVAARLGAQGGDHRATQLTDQQIAGADLVLVASEAHRDEIVSRVPRAMRRTFTMLEAGRIASQLEVQPPRSLKDLNAVVGELARRRVGGGDPGADDIVDPQGKDITATDLMVSQEVPALVQIAVALWGMPAAEATAYLAAASDPASLRR